MKRDIAAIVIMCLGLGLYGFAISGQYYGSGACRVYLPASRETGWEALINSNFSDLYDCIATIRADLTMTPTPTNTPADTATPTDTPTATPTYGVYLHRTDEGYSTASERTADGNITMDSYLGIVGHDITGTIFDIMNGAATPTSVFRTENTGQIELWNTDAATSTWIKGTKAGDATHSNMIELTLSAGFTGASGSSVIQIENNSLGNGLASCIGLNSLADANIASCMGVYARAAGKRSTKTHYGVYGTSDGITGGTNAGVYGYATNGATNTWGVYGEPNVAAADDMYIGADGGDDTRHLYFYQGGSSTGEYLQWDNDGWFEFSDEVIVNGDSASQPALTINQASTGDIFTAKAAGTPAFTIADTGEAKFGTGTPASDWWLSVSRAGDNAANHRIAYFSLDAGYTGAGASYATAIYDKSNHSGQSTAIFASSQNASGANIGAEISCITSSTGDNYGIKAAVSNAGAGTAYAIYGSAAAGEKAGYFSGDVHVVGNITKTGSVSFLIDYPPDANYSLYHYVIETDYQRNLYTFRSATTRGEARIKLPEWARHVCDFKSGTYQLACLNGYSPLWVEEDLDRNETIIIHSPGNQRQEFTLTVMFKRADPYFKSREWPVLERKTTQGIDNEKRRLQKEL